VPVNRELFPSSTVNFVKLNEEDQLYPVSLWYSQYRYCFCPKSCMFCKCSYLNVRKPNDHCECIAKLDNWPDISERALSIWPIEFMSPKVRKCCNKVSQFLLNCKRKKKKIGIC